HSLAGRPHAARFDDLYEKRNSSELIHRTAVEDIVVPDRPSVAMNKKNIPAICWRKLLLVKAPSRFGRFVVTDFSRARGSSGVVFRGFSLGVLVIRTVRREERDRVRNR